MRPSMTPTIFTRSARRIGFGALLLAWPLAHAQDSAPDNPYGIVALWQQSDVVARAALLILATMSMRSW